MSRQTDLRFYSAADVTKVFDVDTAIESQRTAFRELGLGNAQLPARLLMDGAQDSASFCYAARVSSTTGAVCKFGSVVPANADIGLPVISALITVLDPHTGQPLAIMDGTTVTTLRTSAAGAVTAEYLARPGATDLAVIGSGVQAEAHIRSICRLLPIERVRIWSPNAQNCSGLASRLGAELGLDISAGSSAQQILIEAEIVVTCTTSMTPVLESAWLEPGTTVISIGSFAHNRFEVPDDLLPAAAAIVVDDIETSLEHAGPIVKAVKAGTITVDQLIPFGAVVAGVVNARTNNDEIIYANSVGIGVQDAAAAWAIYLAAQEMNLGVALEL